MMRHLLSVLLLCCVGSAQSQPFVETLSPTEVQSALSGNGADHWVKLTDEIGSWAAAIFYGDGHTAQDPAITVLMPEALIALRSLSARKQYTDYQPDAEDLRRSLTVVGDGIAVSSGSGPICASVTRIVLLSDRTGGVVEEAYSSEPIYKAWHNGFGATSQCQSLQARFALSAVRRVQAAAPHGEFLIASFAGGSDAKIYKLRKKHQSKLGLIWRGSAP
jgi:hypothetical protein